MSGKYFYDPVSFSLRYELLTRMKPVTLQHLSFLHFWYRQELSESNTVRKKAASNMVERFATYCIGRVILAGSDVRDECCKHKS